MVYLFSLKHLAEQDPATHRPLDAPHLLLDDTTNPDVEDVSTPLSHAALVQRHVEGRWPG